MYKVKSFVNFAVNSEPGGLHFSNHGWHTHGYLMRYKSTRSGATFLSYVF